MEEIEKTERNIILSKIVNLVQAKGGIVKLDESLVIEEKEYRPDICVYDNRNNLTEVYEIKTKSLITDSAIQELKGYSKKYGLKINLVVPKELEEKVNELINKYGIEIDSLWVY